MSKRTIRVLEDFISYVKTNPVQGADVAENNEQYRLELYDRPEVISLRRRRRKEELSLSRRVPKEITHANGNCLSVVGTEKPCGLYGHNHTIVCINSVEMCPVSGALFLAAAKDYKWSDNLSGAIDRIMEVSD